MVQHGNRCFHRVCLIMSTRQAMPLRAVTLHLIMTTSFRRYRIEMATVCYRWSSVRYISFIFIFEDGFLVPRSSLPSRSSQPSLFFARHEDRQLYRFKVIAGRRRTRWHPNGLSGPARTSRCRRNEDRRSRSTRSQRIPLARVTRRIPRRVRTITTNRIPRGDARAAPEHARQ